jgi:hypothetical protein
MLIKKMCEENKRKKYHGNFNIFTGDENFIEGRANDIIELLEKKY